MWGECSWILFVLFLASFFTACRSSQNEPAKAVRIDLTKLLGSQDRVERSVWLKPVAHVKDLPESVKSRIGRKIADPGGAFNATDVRFFDFPDRRLLFAGLSDKYCLVQYEYGGIAHGYKVALFQMSRNSAVLIWTHAGGKYASLEDFANQTDPAELENEVKDAIL